VRHLRHHRHADRRAERHYRAVDPDNWLVAQGLEREWDVSMSALETAKSELASREKERPHVLSGSERNRLLTLGIDLANLARGNDHAA
jgi:sugar-specific transcriptional regulator TrmB